ncbi:MAG: hypothetical protein ACTSRS_04045 [Candidatus Helarchaeota archaeon]
MLELTDKAREALLEEIKFYIEVEEGKLQASDLALILFVRTQSCSPMTEGGFKEIGVGLDTVQKQRKDPRYAFIENLKELNDLPVFIEKEALAMLEDRTTLVIDARGALEKELIVKNGPVIDLGSCRVTFKRPS